jgi:pyruvate kinase
VVAGADVFLGCSAPGVLTPEMVKTMGTQPIILALANPEPEIRPELAKQVRPDCIIATGRSDYPNQVNNVLCFPYIFRGALDCGATKITEQMKLACVREIAALAKAETSDTVAAAYAGQELSFGPDYIIPTPFDVRLILRIAPAVARAAAESGVATRPIADFDAYRQQLGRFVYQTGLFMRPVFDSARRFHAERPARVVYAEGEDERVLRALPVVLEDRLAAPILVGRPEVIRMRLERAGLKLEAGRDFEVCDPEDDPRFRDYWDLYRSLRGRDGVSPEAAKAAVRRSNTLISALMLQRGEADAMLCGLVGRFDAHLEHIRAVIGQKPRCACNGGDECGDAAAVLAVHHRHLRQRGARRRSAGRDRADGRGRGAALRDAAEGGLPVALELRFVAARLGAAHARGARHLCAACPDIECDGEMHGDAALSETIRRGYLPDSTLSGQRQPAGAAQHRRRQHPVQRAEDHQRPRCHRRPGAARCGQAGACADAVGHRAAHREHDGAGGGRRGRAGWPRAPDRRRFAAGACHRRRLSSAPNDTESYRMRATKIVATLGPASSSPEMLERMIRSGVDVVRLNFSHGTAQDHIDRATLVREAAARAGKEVAIMADLQGPKIRVGKFAGGKTELGAGQAFVLDAGRSEPGDNDGVGLDYKDLPRDVRPGDTLLLNDGLLRLTVDKVLGEQVHTTVVVGGELSNNKGINKAGGGLTAPALTAKDMEDIKTAMSFRCDYLAVSFPKSATDMEMARQLANVAGEAQRHKPALIAKIERSEAIPQLEAILKASDGIMVARGDLAVEVGNAAVPALQKRMIRMAREMDKVVITATQMMESMIVNAVPTRAEVSDVANAVLDGTDAVMLSAETAAGKYPLETVEQMAAIALEAEAADDVSIETDFANKRFGRIDQSIAMGALFTAHHLGCKAILALTESGSTALWMSRHRIKVPIFGLTSQETSQRRMTLYRNVQPLLMPKLTDRDEALATAERLLVARGVLRPGDTYAITCGEPMGYPGGTNMLKVCRVA